MNLDLHVHSKFSLDSPVGAEEYAQTLLEMRSEYDIDGFVLTEHRAFVTKVDYKAMSEKYGILILNATAYAFYTRYVAQINLSMYLMFKIVLLSVAAVIILIVVVVWLVISTMLSLV